MRSTHGPTRGRDRPDGPGRDLRRLAADPGRTRGAPRPPALADRRPPVGLGDPCPAPRRPAAVRASGRQRQLAHVRDPGLDHVPPRRLRRDSGRLGRARVPQRGVRADDAAAHPRRTGSSTSGRATSRSTGSRTRSSRSRSSAGCSGSGGTSGIPTAGAANERLRQLRQPTSFRQAMFERRYGAQRRARPTMPPMPDRAAERGRRAVTRASAAPLGARDDPGRGCRRASRAWRLDGRPVRSTPRRSTAAAGTCCRGCDPPIPRSIRSGRYDTQDSLTPVPSRSACPTSPTNSRAHHRRDLPAGRVPGPRVRPTRASPTCAATPRPSCSAG